MILSIVGVSTPAFWVAIILQIVFGLKLNILPISGFDSAASYILPSVALGARYAGSMARITRTSMLEVLNQDYIRTARAKGAKRWSVILKHAESKPEIGRMFNFKPNTIRRMIATQKAGAETPTMERIITAVSMPFPLCTMKQSSIF